MAKKKTTAKEETDEISDEDLEDQLLGDGEDSVAFDPEADDLDDDLFADLEEEEIEVKDYEYVKARLLEKENNLYKVELLGVSHGFLNFLIEKLLSTEGVEFAAYKETSLSPAILTVMMSSSKKPIKKALQEAAAKMKAELKDLKKEIKATIK